jgi:hypothetical protein
VPAPGKAGIEILIAEVRRLEQQIALLNGQIAAHRARLCELKLQIRQLAPATPLHQAKLIRASDTKPLKIKKSKRRPNG